jgi:hypothetical protein
VMQASMPAIAPGIGDANGCHLCCCLTGRG